MVVRGIRGATVARDNTERAILSSTRELLEEIVNKNPDLRSEDIASIYFTSTEDLDTAYPALAARELGWDMVPLLCAKELGVKHGLKKCIRVLVHWNTDKLQSEIFHVYIGEARQLRPDLSKRSDTQRRMLR